MKVLVEFTVMRYSLFFLIYWQMLLILEMIVELNGRVDKLDYAKRIQNWMHNGFPELGDVSGMGIILLLVY